MSQDSEIVTTEQLQKLVDDPETVTIVAMGRRPNILTWMTELEFRYFRPGSAKAVAMKVAIVEFAATKWVVMTIPKGSLEIAQDIATKNGLRAIQSVPFSAVMFGGVRALASISLSSRTRPDLSEVDWFPIGGDNVYTLEANQTDGISVIAFNDAEEAQLERMKAERVAAPPHCGRSYELNITVTHNHVFSGRVDVYHDHDGVIDVRQMRQLALGPTLIASIGLTLTVREKFKMNQYAVTLLDTQQTVLHVEGAVDENGNPTPLAGTVIFTNQDTTGALILTDHGDGKATVAASPDPGHLGTFTVVASDGVGKVEFDITVVASGEAGLIAGADAPSSR